MLIKCLSKYLNKNKWLIKMFLKSGENLTICAHTGIYVNNIIILMKKAVGF